MKTKFTGNLQVGWANINEPSVYQDENLGILCLQPGNFPIEVEFSDGVAVSGTATFTICATSDEIGRWGRVYEVQHALNADNIKKELEKYPGAEASFFSFVDQKNGMEVSDFTKNNDVIEAHKYRSEYAKKTHKAISQMTI
jgi:hypothetical protein